MSGHRTLPGAEGRLRVAPWRGDTTVAHLTPGRGRATPAAIDQTLAELARHGYRSALTTALAEADQGPYLACGFEVHERLHLLRRPLVGTPRLPEHSAHLRRGRQAERPAILLTDAAAFPEFWQLDEAGLLDALHATASARLRVAVDEHDAVVGYAITGRSGPRGYLQRLAVHPGAQRQGLGEALVHDGLRWLRRWGAHEALVNTQEGNAAAVRLYERLGFRRQIEGLAVLRRSIHETAL